MKSWADQAAARDVEVRWPCATAAFRIPMRWSTWLHAWLARPVRACPDAAHVDDLDSKVRIVGIGLRSSDDVR